jgi:glycosyltransferase involved in cell wall biosynthesis
MPGMAPHSNTRRLPRVVVLNNEIMPYRIPLFRAIHQSGRVELIVLFSTLRSWERKWEIDPATLNFPYRILPGFSFRLPKPNYAEKRTLFFNPTLFFDLLRYRPNVVIGYEFSIPALTALAYCRLFRRPYIVWSECTAHTDRALSRGQRWTRRIIIPRAQGFLGTSRAACQNLIRLGADPKRVLEAPQVYDFAGFSSKVEAARQNPPDSPAYLLFVGSLTERKGIDLLLDAFFPVAAQKPDILLRIVGTGPLRNALEKKVRAAGLSDRVQFAGFVDPARIPLEYARAKAFILPSHEDTFGVVVVEALASRVPVICSSFAGVSDYLQDGENGFIVDPHDSSLLAQRILGLLEDHALAEKFSEQGPRIARHFEPASVAEVLLETVQRVIQQ